MKTLLKSILTYLVLMLMPVTVVSAQKKNVDAAWRLVGKTDAVAEARNLLKEAMSHTLTAADARTYYVAAMVEWKSYDADVRKREINPKDGSVKDADMTAKMLAGYRYMLRALSLDSVLDKKGKMKLKYSREIFEQLDSRASDLYRAGVYSYGAQKYYPDAYDAFMGSAAIALTPGMVKAANAIPDSLRTVTFYYAGLSAYGGNQPLKALKAFERAERQGMTTETLFLSDLAIWDQLARDSVHMQAQANDSILNISKRGYANFGITIPDFLNRMTQIYISKGEQDTILSVLNRQIELTPDAWLPRGLRGWVYESMGRTDNAIADYKLAAEHPDISAKMLIRGAHLLYRIAHARKEDITGSRQQRRQMAKNLIDNYLMPASAMAKRAQEKSTDSRDIESAKNILDAVDYDVSVLK